MQGADDGAVGAVRGCVRGGVAPAWLYAADGRDELRQVARFSGWMQAGGLLRRGSRCGDGGAFLSWQRSSGRWRSSWSRPGLVCLLEVLRELGVLGPSGRSGLADRSAAGFI